MIIKKDHQPAVLMFVLFSTKRQCACYQISHSAPISRATISSSRLVKAISNWEGYQNHVQQVLEISCLEMHGPCTVQPGINVGLHLLNFGFFFMNYRFFQVCNITLHICSCPMLILFDKFSRPQVSSRGPGKFVKKK